MTTHNKIKKYLQSGNAITGYIAWTKFSCYRLAVVINRLRKEGMNIKTTMQCPGKTYSFASYKLIK